MSEPMSDVLASAIADPGSRYVYHEENLPAFADVEALRWNVLLDREGEKIGTIEHIEVDPSELAEIGDYDLEALFIRLELAVEQVGAKRVVLDTIESLFSAFSRSAGSSTG